MELGDRGKGLMDGSKQGNKRPDVRMKVEVECPHVNNIKTATERLRLMQSDK